MTIACCALGRPQGQRRGHSPYGVQHGLAKGALRQALRLAGVELGEPINITHYVRVQALAQLPCQLSNTRLYRKQQSFANLRCSAWVLSGTG